MNSSWLSTIKLSTYFSSCLETRKISRIWVSFFISGDIPEIFGQIEGVRGIHFILFIEGKCSSKFTEQFISPRLRRTKCWKTKVIYSNPHFFCSEVMYINGFSICSFQKFTEGLRVARSSFRILRPYLRLEMLCLKSIGFLISKSYWRSQLSNCRWNFTSRSWNIKIVKKTGNSIFFNISILGVGAGLWPYSFSNTLVLGSSTFKTYKPILSRQNFSDFKQGSRLPWLLGYGS